MCIRAIHNQIALHSGVGVDHCVLNAISCLHREYLLRKTQSPWNECVILSSENSAILRTSWITPPRMAGGVETTSSAVIRLDQTRRRKVRSFFGIFLDFFCTKISKSFKSFGGNCFQKSDSGGIIRIIGIIPKVRQLNWSITRYQNLCRWSRIV